ncbi:MAG: response regulator, partial [Planctomycetia bacterium]|nr:response regulator [Planctomycetia bacterium]
MPKKIMIIDDDIDLVEAMRITLETDNYEVIDAQEGQKGLEKLKKEKPDLLILDVMMGTLDEGF